jgi:phosphoacetylglucosamine mutase
MVNEATGDAISDLLLALFILDQLKWSFEKWDGLYQSMPCRLLKLSVPEKSLFESDPLDEERLVRPAGFQDTLSQIVGKGKEGAVRAFVRPSGTENYLRVYVEAESVDAVARVAAAIERAVFLRVSM